MALPSTRHLIVPSEQRLAPVTLRPPAEILPEPAPPVKAATPAMTAPLDWKAIEADPLPAPAKTATPAQKPAATKKTAQAKIKPIEIPLPGRKPVITHDANPVAEDITAAIDPTPPVEESPVKETATIAPPNEPPALLLPPVAEPVTVARAEDSVAEDKNIFQKIFSFPVKTSVRTRGGLDPASPRQDNIPDPAPIEQSLAAAPQTTAPEPEETFDVAALTPDMPQENWQQENPEILIADVPLPPERPDKQIAPKAFVQEARRAMVNTYTSTEARGVANDPMVAHAKARRLSVADLAGDPLASQLMDMSVDDVANVLNNIAPAAGHHLSRELNTVSKPRIVRVEGEWIRRSQMQPQPQNTTPPAQSETPPARAIERASIPLPVPDTQIEAKLASLPAAKKADPAKTAQKQVMPQTLSLPFKPGQVDMDEATSAPLKPEIIATLKKAPDNRIQILAYSSAPDGKESQARRIALSRALAVRSWLVAQGIDAGRMDVKALGIPTDDKNNADRVEMLIR